MSQNKTYQINRGTRDVARDKASGQELTRGRTGQYSVEGPLKTGRPFPPRGHVHEITRRSSDVRKGGVRAVQNPLAEVAGTFEGEAWDALQAEIQRNRRAE
jgi:hypothetical protein